MRESAEKRIEREDVDANAVHRAPRHHASRRSAADRAHDEYAGAFTRVRLVRAWIAAAAALVAVLSGYVALLERVLR